MQQEQQGSTAMTFTANDWATLTKTIPDELRNMSSLLQESIRASREEAESIRQSIRASDARCEGALKAANIRIDEAGAMIRKQETTLIRWAAVGCASSAMAFIMWQLMKFLFNRGG